MDFYVKKECNSETQNQIKHKMSKHQLLARESTDELIVPQEDLVVTEFSVIKEGSPVTETIHENQTLAAPEGVPKQTSNEFFVKSDKVSLIGKYRIKLPGEAKRVSVRCSLLLPNGWLVLVDNNNENTKLFDPDFKCTSVLKPKIYDICLSNIDETEIYATGFAGSIYRVATQPGLKILKTFEVPGGCWGITSCLQDKIATTVRQGDVYALLILNIKGEVVHRIEEDDIQDLKFGDPLYLSTIKNGQQIVISDWSKNSVTCLDLEVGVIFVYEDIRLKRPHSIATDGNDNIFVACRVSNNIHQISVTTGKKVDILLTRQDELISPGGLEYDAEHNTIILQAQEEADDIAIYQLEGDISREKTGESGQWGNGRKFRERTVSDVEHEQ